MHRNVAATNPRGRGNGTLDFAVRFYRFPGACEWLTDTGGFRLRLISGGPSRSQPATGLFFGQPLGG